MTMSFQKKSLYFQTLCISLTHSHNSLKNKTQPVSLSSAVRIGFFLHLVPTSNILLYNQYLTQSPIFLKFDY